MHATCISYRTLLAVIILKLTFRKGMPPFGSDRIHAQEPEIKISVSNSTFTLVFT